MDERGQREVAGEMENGLKGAGIWGRRRMVMGERRVTYGGGEKYG